MGGILADEAVWLGELWIPAAEHIGGVQLGVVGVEMIDDPCQQGFVFGGVELFEVWLPPDLVDELRPRHSKGVLYRSAGACRVAVIHERAVFAQRCCVRLLCIAWAVERNTPSVVRNGCVEQLVLAQSVVQLHIVESELGCELVSNRG